jgi:hypothetical protein
MAEAMPPSRELPAPIKLTLYPKPVFLTLIQLLDTVRRFREYLERAVTKRPGGRQMPAHHWIQEIHRRIRPDNRG